LNHQPFNEREEKNMDRIFQKMSLAAAILLLLGLAATQPAQAFPTQPVTIIMAWGAGGATDVVARALQPVWAKNLGGNIIIKNVVGAAGTIGTAEAAAASPDGHTIIVTPAGPMTTQPHLRKLPYAVSSFAPIGRIAISPQVMMVPKTSPYKTLQDLLNAAKKEPGKIIAASTGAGTLPHIGIIVLNQMGYEMKHLPFKGSADAMKALLGGTAHVFSDQAQLVPAFDVRPLATWTAKRLPEFPDVPALKEFGIDVDIYNWVGAFAPLKTPPDILAKLESSLLETLKDPAIIEAIQKLRVQHAPMPGKEFGPFALAESERNKKLLAAAGLLAQ
jgi:tripartite-type tricarboxylate transporter receptor subunit TctC